MNRTDAPLAGALLLLASEATFAAMNALIKLASVNVPTATILAIRHWLALALLLPIAWQRGWIGRQTPAKLRFHAARSLTGLAAMWTSFWAVGHLPLADAAVLKMTSPLFVPLIAALWLGERLGPRIAWAALIGFAGVLAILKPGSGLFVPAALVGLASGALAALARVTIRRMSIGIGAGEIVFWFTLVGTLLTTPAALAAGVVPGVRDSGIIAALALLGTLGQLLMTRAYASAPAGIVGPLGYTGVLFATGFGWAIWQERPDLATVTGTLAIVAAGLLVMLPARRG